MQFILKPFAQIFFFKFNVAFFSPSSIHSPFHVLVLLDLSADFDTTDHKHFITAIRACCRY